MARRPSNPASRLSRRTFLTTAAALAGAASGRRVFAGSQQAAERPLAPSDRVALAVVGAGGRGADNIRDVDDDRRADRRAVRLRRAERGRVVREVPRRAEVSRLAPHARCREDDRRGARRHARPQPRDRLGRRDAARQACLLREAAGAQHLGSAADGEGRERDPRRDADGHAGPRIRRHPPRGRGHSGGRDRRRHRAARLDRPAGRLVAAGRAAPDRHAARAADARLGRVARPGARAAVQPAYVPFKWRGFWDFGTGAIGDMGIHNLDTAYWALELGTPTRVSIRDCSPGADRPRHEGDRAALEHHRSGVPGARQPTRR